MTDGRARIGWLHVSDLHATKEKVGRSSLRRPGSELWADVQRGFFEDLDAQLDATGLQPDLVLITGDLAYSGAATQYADLEREFLTPLREHLRGRGGEPVVFAVPGNHDVQRPSRREGRSFRLLREYDTRDDHDEDLRGLREELWHERNAEFLAPLFDGYVGWMERAMLPGLEARALSSGLVIEGLHRSHLPGDLSVVVARDGLRLLLVGLNSAWIQFDGGDFQGKLHVPVEQLYAALAPDDHAALRRFDDVDGALLLMHHPRQWLSAAAQRVFDGYVYPARDERWSACLFGHMHEARSEMSAGNGSALRHFYQSPSLFGLEHYGESQERLDVGYTLGALYEDEEIRLWVRRLANNGRFAVDPELCCEPDGALVLRRARGHTRARARRPARTFSHADARADDVGERPSDRATLGAWLLGRHDKLELLAPTSTFSYPFEEVYIPLEIAMQEAWRGSREGKARDGDLERGQLGMGREIELAEIFARARDDREVALLGHPGAGKTTTLEKICHQMLIEGGEAVGLPRETLPLLLPLQHVTPGDLAQEDPLLALAQREAARGEPPLPTGVLERLWAQGGLLLLLDGLDEVADAELRTGVFEHIVRRAPARRRRGVRHLVSSRFSGVTPEIQGVLDGTFLRLDVRPLGRDRIEALVHSWFRAAKSWQAAPRTADERARVEAEAREHAGRVLVELRRIEREDFEFRALVGSPLLLTLLCAVALANGQIPHKRHEFHQRCLEVLLRRYTHKTGQPAPVPEAEALRMLHAVAHGLHEQRRRGGLSAARFGAWVPPMDPRHGRAHPSGPRPAELLRWLHEHAGVLTKHGEDDYGFSHLAVQEYLAALHVAYGGDRAVQQLADRFGDPWWQEVTLSCLALPHRRTFEVFMNRVLDGDRWLFDVLRDDGEVPGSRRESRPPMQLLRECWEASDERTVGPFLRVLQRPRTHGGWLGWVRGVFGQPLTAEHIDRQRTRVLKLLLGATDPALVELAEQLEQDVGEDAAVRALAGELVARARRVGLEPSEPSIESAREDALASGVAKSSPLESAREERQAPQGDEDDEVHALREDEDDRYGGTVSAPPRDEEDGALRRALNRAKTTRGPEPSAAPAARPAPRPARVSDPLRTRSPTPLPPPTPLPATSCEAEPMPAPPSSVAPAVVARSAEPTLASATADMEAEEGDVRRESIDHPRFGVARRSARDAWVEPRTGIRLLWVPEGTFMMGSKEDEPGSYDDERPAHRVTLHGFWLAETPVTNAQYAVFVEAAADVPEPRMWRDRRFSTRAQPVVGVTWHDATAFCRWLGEACQQRMGLPSEAQWEYVARGTDGRRYPWGDDRPDESRGCFGRDLATGQTATVGQYPRGRGPFGHLDLAGNVWEWCQDAWDPMGYPRAEASSLPALDPMIDGAGASADADERACRGSSWGHPAGGLRAAYRHHHRADGWGGGLGFRVGSFATGDPTGG